MFASAYLRLFSAAHVAIMAAIPAGAAVLSWTTRTYPRSAKPIRYLSAILLAVAALCWYAFRFRTLHLVPPQGLPFELCDISLWLSVYSLLRLQQPVFELAYYWGLSGTLMAVLTPDLIAPLRSFSSIVFFVDHGGLILAILYLLWSRQMRPRPQSWKLAFAALNIYAAAIGLFDCLTGTNYFYLRNKPASASLLNVMGPWPYYMIGADLLALVIFVALSVPFWKPPRPQQTQAAGEPT